MSNRLGSPVQKDHLLQDESVGNVLSTVNAGKDSKELEGGCLEMAGATALLEFFLKLKEKRVGTNPIESKARSMMKEKVSKEGGKTRPKSKTKEVINKGGKELVRDEEVVVILLEVKVKATFEHQQLLERKYKEKWREFEKTAKPGSRKWKRKYKRLKEVREENKRVSKDI